MEKLEYQELKKEHIKDFFFKILNENYELLIRAGIYSYFFTHYYDDEFDLFGKKEEIIDEGFKERYSYEDFEELISNKKFKKFIIDEEKKFIVVVK